MRCMLLACAAAVAAPAAHATVIYAETFDSYTPALNFTAFNPPGMVSDGTVDVVANGSFGITCAGGAGNCLDLDGSTGNSGIFSFAVNLAPASYVFSFSFSGNQRNAGPDVLTIEMLEGMTTVFSNSTSLAGSAPFTSFALPFTVVAPALYSFRFSTSSNDNIGPILDDIRLARNERDVPAPAALALFGLGLAALGLRRR